MALNSRQLAAGTRLGNYTVRATLGHGANATVYLAEDRRDRRRVALKALHNDRNQDVERAPHRMRREVALLQRIHHPGICRVFEMGEDQGLLYLAMEYLEGQTLEATLRASRRLSVERTLRLTRELCEAMMAAHEQEIVHRDLKPGNVMLRADGTPVLLDFGYATAPDVSRVTATGAWVGTLQYVAPEILRNEVATVRSDVYSLGAIMYQCLCGQLPFGGRSYGEVASAKIYQDPRPIEELVDSVPSEVAAIVRQAMHREASARYADAKELLHALDALTREEKRREPTLVVRERQVAPPAAVNVREQNALYLIAVRDARRSKGLCVGDLATVDALERTATMELAAGRVAESCECLRLALTELESLSVDDAFIRAKIQRFEKAMRAGGGYARMARLAPVLDRVMRAFEERRFDAANAALNEAFVMLEERKD